MNNTTRKRKERKTKKEQKLSKEPTAVEETVEKFSLAEDERLKSIVVGKATEDRFFLRRLYKEAPDRDTAMDLLNKEEKEYFNLIRKSMEFQLKWLQKMNQKNLEVKSSYEIFDGYKYRSASFTVIAPVKEKLHKYLKWNSPN